MIASTDTLASKMLIRRDTCALGIIGAEPLPTARIESAGDTRWHSVAEK